MIFTVKLVYYTPNGNITVEYEYVPAESAEEALASSQMRAVADYPLLSDKGTLAEIEVRP
jgi:hypothetical protein